MYVTEFTYRGDPETVAKEFLPIVSAAAEIEAENWHKKTLPGHFLTSAVGKYGYRYITLDYARRKARMARRTGQTGPMVFTGEMKSQILRRYTVRSLKTKLDVRLKIWARAVNLWSGPHRKHDFPAYLTNCTDAEIQAMAQSIQARATKTIATRSWPTRTVRP